MNILVCVKHVPDTETRIRIGDDGKSIREEGVKFVLNPNDEFAVEEALQLREKAGQGEVTVLSLGSDKVVETLRKCLAMGADKAVHLKDDAFEGSDSLGIARALSAAVKTFSYDLIFTGHQGIGADNSQIGVLMAEMLDIPHVSVVTALEINGSEVKATREIEGGREVVTTSLPAVITTQKGLNNPRYPALKGIMMAKKKEIALLSASDLSLDSSMVGESGALVKIVKLELPPEKAAGKILDGEPEDAARELVKILHDEKVL